MFDAFMKKAVKFKFLIKLLIKIGIIEEYTFKELGKKSIKLYARKRKF